MSGDWGSMVEGGEVRGTVKEERRRGVQDRQEGRCSEIVDEEKKCV